MNFKKHLNLFLILAIFIVALFLRFYRLDAIPVGFHVDEANLGYNAYSILLTGKDDSGNFLPLYVNMFNDFNPTGYHYLDVIPVVVFGLSIFAVRFPAALFGALIIFPIYFIGAFLFKKRVGVIAAIFCAISPWGVIFSRSSAETIVATFFVVSGIAFLVDSLKSQRTLSVVSAVIFFTLSVLVYPAPRVFIPILFFIFLFFPVPFWKHENRNLKKALVIGFIVFSFITAALIFNVNGGTNRFNQVSIFTYPETKLVEEEQIREDGVMNSGVLASRAFHNKIVGYSWSYANNYFKYFTGGFLFTAGGRPVWFLIPQVGMILIFEFPFILYGLYLVAKNKDNTPKILFVWLLLAPAIAALTVDDSPNMRRAMLLFPVLELFAAYGLVEFVDKFRANVKVIIIFFILIIAGLNFSFFMHQYFGHQPIHQNWYRNEGFDTMVSKVESKYDAFDKIVVTKNMGGIYPLILFYTKYDPKVYQAEGSTKDGEYTGFGKFFFVPQECPSVNGDKRFPKGKVLYVEQGTCEVTPLKKQEYIKRIDGSPVFHLVYEEIPRK